MTSRGIAVLERQVFPAGTGSKHPKNAVQSTPILSPRSTSALWVSEAVKRSAPTARLPIPHPSPQPLILKLGLKFKSCL
jgi:hypothetical protein